MTVRAEIFTQDRWTILMLRANRRVLAAEHIQELTPSDRSRVLALLHRVAEVGPPTNVRQNRKLEGHILELKSAQTRLLYFFDGPHRIVVTHAFTKKQQKLPRRELDRANRLRDEYLRDS